ncbi:hypothetical protein [Sphingobacterium thalpophilum]|uniref:hypothetical protein n=1 Tax=Sphingobacterium thalpophilum TaxID=259 RepID=UPI003D97A233
MTTKLENSIRLKNLTFSDIVQNLSHVSLGNYYLPNSNDECTTVNNEASFENWKSKTLLRYPNAQVLFDSKAIWSKRVQIVDNGFQYDKKMFLQCKANAYL